VRENTEGLYAGLDFRPTPDRLADALGLDAATRGDDVAITARIVTRRAVRRVARAAFALARTRPARRVTLAEKPNVMRATGGLFLEETRAVAAEHPDVAFAWENADAVCARMVREPERYDVLLAGNLFGDLLSDLAAGLAGGLGLLPSANLGDEAALFEPAHGSAPDIAGRGVANPIAAILAAAMLLDRIGEGAAAASVRRAVDDVVADARTLTPDLGGRASTTQVARAVAAAVSVPETRETRERRVP
ncbi:MAG: isocitrate/isopropylmalate family dehydrogenase, partial [Planctomycetota bacterium JB042]